MNYDNLIYTKEENIGIITLNRPKQRNPLTTRMGAELRELVTAVKGDRSIRAVILTGAGKSFSAGGDLRMLERSRCASGYDNKNYYRDFYPLFLSIMELEVPVIAAINGHAIGAGLCLALACDIRYAAEDAVLGLNFTRLGIHPGMGATWFLPRIVGMQRAAELLYTGRNISGTEAGEMNLVAGVFKGEELMEKVMDRAEDIASSAPIAVQMVKKALRQSMDNSLDAQLEFESFCQGMTLGTGDFREGIKSIKEKKPPRFTGK